MLASRYFTHNSTRSFLAASTLALALGIFASVVLVEPVSAGQGTGNPRLSVSASTVSSDRPTDITVTGTDFLVPPYAEGADVFGGVYVFFGWVSNPNHFGPSTRNSSSNNGTYGVTYAYPGDGGDPGTRDPGTGLMRFASFTAGGESGQATIYHMDRDGNWSVPMRIYGSSFEYIYPVTGEVRTVNCLEVQCGIFTIGAHGKASSTNEQFIPINFTAPATPPPTSNTPPPTAANTTPPANSVDLNQQHSGTPNPELNQAGEDNENSGEPDSDTGAIAPETTDVSADPTNTSELDPASNEVGEVVALSVTSMRDSGSSSTGLVVALVAILGAITTLVWFLRHRQQNRNLQQNNP